MTDTAPGTTPLPRVKAEYVRDGMTHVRGWLAPSTALYLSSLEVLQREQGTAGDICEIGIHHGLSFLCLALALPPGQRAVAIDLFGGEGNVDNSGEGDRRIFERNFAKHGGDPAAIDVIQASSMDLDRIGFTAQGRRFRLFSIDGGHTPEITCNDLRVAEQTVVDGGLVVLDDVLNSGWLGVITGLFEYWATGGTLVPAVLVPNKLILGSSIEAAKSCRQLMDERFGPAIEKLNVPLGAHEIDVYGEYPWMVADEGGTTGPLAKAPRMRPPLRRRVADRMPGLARVVRPVLARVRARRATS
jgi:predicted O-methyltransferase YrrM